MPSKALGSLFNGLEEVTQLLAANPTRSGNLPSNPALARAVNRSGVVLLCSHFERYFYAATEEAITLINATRLAGEKVPLRLRLQHSRVAIDDEIGPTQWDRRASKLEDFTETDAWLWGKAPQGQIDANRVLRWMKSPGKKAIVKLYRLWEIDNIFETITKTAHTRVHLELKLQELVDKRNSIAHGEATTEATLRDLRSYTSVVKTFVKRVDRQLAKRLELITGAAAGW